MIFCRFRISNFELPDKPSEYVQWDFTVHKWAGGLNFRCELGVGAEMKALPIKR